MPQYIIKLNDEKKNRDYYLLWSTVVDAPVTFGLTLDELKEYYREEYGENGMEKLNERLARVEATGCSAFPNVDSLQDLLDFNRAGQGERHLDKEGILDEYCRNHTEWLIVK